MTEKLEQYAAQITMNNVKMVMRLEGRSLGHVMDQIAEAARDRTPLSFVHDDAVHATMVIPDSGMAVQLLPWDEYLEQMKAAKEHQAAMQGNDPPGRVLMPNRGFPRPTNRR